METVALPAGPASLILSTLPDSLARVILYGTLTVVSTVWLPTVVGVATPVFTVTGVFVVVVFGCEAATGPVTAAVGAVIGKVTWTERIRPSSTKNAPMLIVSASDSNTSTAVFPLTSVNAQTLFGPLSSGAGRIAIAGKTVWSGIVIGEIAGRNMPSPPEKKQTRSPVIAAPVMSWAWATHTAVCWSNAEGPFGKHWISFTNSDATDLATVLETSGAAVTGSYG